MTNLLSAFGLHSSLYVWALGNAGFGTSALAARSEAASDPGQSVTTTQPASETPAETSPSEAPPVEVSPDKAGPTATAPISDAPTSVSAPSAAEGTPENAAPEAPAEFELELEEDGSSSENVSAANVGENSGGERKPVSATESFTSPTGSRDHDSEVIEVEQVSIFGDEERRRKLAGSGHFVGEEELEALEFDDISRVLSAVPGVYLRGEDGFGLRPNIGLRGANSDRSAKVTLMEDGVLMAPAPYSAPAAYYFPLVTRLVGVSVFKGPSAIRFGPNTIGGAINLRTRDVPRGSAGAVDLAMGNQNAAKLHAHLGYGGRHWGVVGEALRLHNSGFKELDGGGDTGFIKQDFMLKGRYHSGSSGPWYHQVDAKLGYGTEESRETYLGLTDADFKANPYRRYAASQLGEMQWWRSQGMLRYFVARGELFDIETTLYRHDFQRDWTKANRFRSGPSFEEILAEPQSGIHGVYYSVLTGQTDSATPGESLMIGTNDRNFVSQGIANVVHVRPRWGSLQQDIEFGARLHYDRIIRRHTEDPYRMAGGKLLRDVDPQQTIANNRGETTALALHLHDLAQWGRWTLSPGIRFEYIGSKFEDKLDPASEISKREDAVWIPGMGVHFSILPQWGVLAGVHSGFSPVSPGQDKKIKPERSINYEAGSRVYLKHFHAEAIGFLNDYSNLTGECTFSGGCTADELNAQFNAGRALTYGAETGAGYQRAIGQRASVGLRATYTLTLSSFRESFSSTFPQWQDVEKGDRLPYVPVHQGAVNLDASFDRVSFGSQLALVGEMRDVAGPANISEAERIPGYAVLDFVLGVRVWKRGQVYGQVNNALNSTYAVSRRPFGLRPGRPFSFMIGVKQDLF